MRVRKGLDRLLLAFWSLCGVCACPANCLKMSLRSQELCVAGENVAEWAVWCRKVVRASSPPALRFVD